jgi:HTH-type transcriptional regulator/antitoxin HigA
MNKIEYKELIAFHPGYYVKDYIDDQGITKEELAKRLQTTPQYVNDLVNGRISLTDEMATRLSDVFGTSVTLWRNLNKSYNEKKAEIEQRMQTDEKFKLQSSWNNRRKVPVG